MEREIFLQALFERARAAGFSACEAYYAAGSSFSVSVFQGEITDYSAADAIGLSFRGLYGGKMGYASTQALDGESIDLLVEGARENAALIECADEQFLFPGGDAYAAVDNFNPAVDAVSAAGKIALCRRLERAALDADPRVRQVGDCTVFSESGEVQIVNSLGLNVRHRSNLIGGYVEPVAVEGENTSSGSALFFENDPARIDIEAAARRGVREAVDGLDAQSVPSGSYRVLLRNDCAAGLLATFSGVFSADRAQKGLSLLAGREGERIAADCLTIADEPHLPGQPASRPFDAEGVPTRAKDVVRNGALQTLLHSLKTARKQGVSTTANAAKGGYAASVSVAPSNLCVRPSQTAFDEMLGRVGDGLFIIQLLGQHAGADAVSGDFSLSARGYRVEGGKLAGAVRQITLAGNFFALLRDLEAVGDDPRFAFPGSSGFSSPCLLVKALSVAGK